MRRLWSGASKKRDFDGLHEAFLKMLREIRRRAPQARIVVVTYPTLLPPAGTCLKLGISDLEVAAMRAVGQRLADTTRSVAREAGADLVDMEQSSAAHHVCSSEPWVNGWKDPAGAQYHPNLAGATATAEQIAHLLRGSAA